MTILCNNCYKPLTKEELKDYSIQWQYSGDMYCMKCRKKLGLGKHDTRDTIPFDADEAMKSGVYISGTTGTGKSDIAMYQAEELMKEGIIIIVFDPTQD